MDELPLGYLRRPWSEARRKAASLAAIAKSGAKPGHRLLYGINVHQRDWPLIAKAANRYRHGKGKARNLEQTRAFIRTLMRMLSI